MGESSTADQQPESGAAEVTEAEAEAQESEPNQPAPASKPASAPVTSQPDIKFQG